MIPVFEPDVGHAEAEAVARSVRRGEISGTYGEALTEFEERFATYCGSRFGVAVSSGTTALHLAVQAADIGPGDEVLVSASTNIATALAVVHNGAVPVPVDSEELTWNLDLDLLEGLLTERTRAIIAVHLYGHPVDMDALNRFAAEHDLVVIEDAAEAHGAEVRGDRVGSLGHIGCFSFYANKIITTGEGGMVTTDDEDLAERLRLLRNLAFTEPRFRHEELGHNFRMTAYQAAMGLVQLDRIEGFIADKRRVAEGYRERLGDEPGLRFQPEEDWARNVYWMVGMLVGPEFGASRDDVMRHLAYRGIGSRTFFCPMNQQPALLERAARTGTSCPVADRLWETGVYLPSSTTLTDDELDTVADAIRDAA